MPNPGKKQPDQTRQLLLEAAFNEIHHRGFQAASVDNILKNTGVTKGALYHHFGSKNELGYAVVDEIIRPFVEERWASLTHADDPITAAIDLIHRLREERRELAVTLGCPFNNLCQEMSAVDEGFRERLSTILRNWREGMIRSIERGQKNGVVRKDIDPDATATFIIGSLEGCIGMTKANKDPEFLDTGMQGMIQYLEHLRPEPATHDGTTH